MGELNAGTAVSVLLVLTAAAVLALFALGHISSEVFIIAAGVLALAGLVGRSGGGES